MSTSEIRALLDTSMLLGESPFWHPEESSLYWIDIAASEVHRYHPATRSHRAFPVPSEPGCIARCAEGGVIVAMRTGLAILDTARNEITPVADAPYAPSKMRFNDGRCDAAGRLWIGTAYDARDQALGSLFCVERGTIRSVDNPVTVSNGVAFSIDNRTLYHADTSAHRICAYDYDVSSGKTENGRIFKQFSADKTHNYGGRPDGAAVDSENAYWCAMYEGGRLLRLSSSGDLLQEFPLPVRCPTMVAFGGEDMKTLFITTVRNKRPAEELARHPLSGCILTMRVEVPGCVDPAYIP